MVSTDELDALLPQTQCTRCGYPGCRPYAQAMADGSALLNRCPPGGAATIAALARLMGCEPLPLDPAHGSEGPPLVARIDEEECIGCARCLPPCPVDAIIGARRQMHTVVAELCTGCELCLAPCPVDCIRLLPRDSAPDSAPAPDPESNRARFTAHRERAQRRAQEQAALIASRKESSEARA
jgi:Na+-translocating ferredoxin:NAD+ oxidoreductase subunit B